MTALAKRVRALLPMTIPLVVLVGAGCSGESTTSLELQVASGTPAESRFWPTPPDVPRYRYVGDLLGEQNIHVDGSENAGGWTKFWMGVWKVITGLGERSLRPVVLERPQSGATDSQGRIYVTDVSRRAVFVFDAVEGKLRVWEYADAHRRFVSPISVSIDNLGRLMVTDAELAEIFRFTADGAPIDHFGEGILKRPTGIAFDTDEQRIYVADTEANDIKVFNPDGSLLDVIGYAGDEAGRLNRPVYLAFANGKLFVSDGLNARVQVFDRDGRILSVIGQRGLYVGNLTRPKGVAVDSEGHIYVVEGFYDHLLIFDANGQYLLGIGGTGQRPGEFYLPTGVWTDDNNRIYVADMFNGRVSIFQFLGGDQ